MQKFFRYELEKIIDKYYCGDPATVQGEILQSQVILREGTKFRKGNLLVRIFDEEARNIRNASNDTSTSLSFIPVPLPKRWKRASPSGSKKRSEALQGSRK
ncbi:MAG: hypothetical protein ABIJ04_03260 [Bacteroidota bacterium]